MKQRSQVARWLVRRAWLTLFATPGSVLMAFFLSTIPLAMAAEQVTQEASAGMAVTAAKATKACFFEKQIVTGTVVLRREVLIRPDREGLVIKDILVEPGETVSATQVLARLAPGRDAQPASVVAICAPVSGLVVAGPNVVGEMVSARGQPLFRIVADGELDLAAEVPANRISRLAPDQTAKIKAIGMDEVPGAVRLVPLNIDPVTQLGQVRIALERNSSLHIGAFARAEIELANTCGVTVPLSSLLFETEGPVVQVIRDNRVETRRVTVGVVVKDSILIRDGVAEGDLIVVRAGAFLRDGDRVRAMVGGN